MSSNDQFLGGMEGAEQEAPAKVAVKSRPSSRPPTYTPNPSAVAHVEKARQDILTEWRNRAPADPNAEIIGFDDWQRKIELHAPGWETDKHLQARRFVAHDVVYIQHGIMAHTLTTGTVYDNNTNYIQGHNDPSQLQAWADWISASGEFNPPNDTKRAVLKPIKGHILCRDGGKTLTVGLCPVYEVEVSDGPLKGLRLLELPSMLRGADGVDGDGIKGS